MCELNAIIKKGIKALTVARKYNILLANDRVAPEKADFLTALR